MYSLSLWCTVGCRILLGLTIYFMFETLAFKSIFRQGTLTIFPYIADLFSRNIINITHITSCKDATCCHQPSYKSKLNTLFYLQYLLKWLVSGICYPWLFLIAALGGGIRGAKKCTTIASFSGRQLVVASWDDQAN